MTQTTATPAQQLKKKFRIHELDLLRGFFIFVIIVDHLQRWPSPLTYLTGEGRLWVSAAEGFFIISGLLIGYIRGFKGQKYSLSSLTKTVLSRALTLYLWSVIITFVAVALVQAFSPNLLLIPKLPETSGLTYAWQVLTQQYVFDWIFFLRLYWMMLLATPLALLAFRRGLWWLVPIVSIVFYGLSTLSQAPEAALQWQVLFFVSATIGFHLEKIILFIKSKSHLKNILVDVMIAIGIVTMIASYFWVLGWNFVERDDPYLSRDTYVAARTWLDPIFSKEPLALGRILLSFVWVGSLLALFHWLRKPIEKYLGWLLKPLGTFSLTAYCLQAIVLLFFQFFIPPTTNWLINLMLGIISVVVIRFMTTQKHLHKILPQ